MRQIKSTSIPHSPHLSMRFSELSKREVKSLLSNYRDRRWLENFLRTRGHDRDRESIARFPGSDTLKTVLQALDSSRFEARGDNATH